ncbi:hypothetical protein SU48_05015 [Deinococcus puniceus]|uniref:AB hydrolase-1 domain-containing protein n=1 Tax=Deinococcus puniceus TaxID=1182568 RepID=A0A172T8B5_9DEIO|nr:hypothetical protein SU48_05015 [Deinococcus puniceus]
MTELGLDEPALILLSGLGDPAAWWFSVPTSEEARPHWIGNDTGERRVGMACALAPIARVIAYDRAGIGASAAPNHDRSWPELFAELDAVLNAAKLTQPPILVGHSLGGLIAFAYARRHPQNIGGLVLLDPTPPPMSPRPHGDSPERLALTHFEPSELAPQSLGSLPLLLLAPGRPATVDEVRWQQPAATQDALNARFSSRREQHQRMVQTSARGQGVWTSGSGHYVHLDTPQEVAQAIQTFWASLSSHNS